MVISGSRRFTASGDYIIDYTGKSSEVKPVTNLATGSTFYELDTQNLYMFDGDSGVWFLQ